MRAGLGTGAKSEAKLRKSTKYPGGRRVNSRYARVLRKIPGILPIWPKIWLILGPNQPQTRLRAQNLTISTEFSREKREEKRGCCREKRKGKQTGCERKTSPSPTRPPSPQTPRTAHIADYGERAKVMCEVVQLLNDGHILQPRVGASSPLSPAHIWSPAMPRLG